MAYQTLAQADAILKELYVGPMIEQLNYKTYMLDQVERDSDKTKFRGRRAIVPVHSRSNRSAGSIVDGGTLPTPGRQGYLDAIVDITYHSKGIALSDQSVKQAQGGEGSFVDLLDMETKSAAKDMRKGINRQVFGDGTGILASVTAATTNTVTVDSTQYLEIDDPIDLLVRSTGAELGTGSAGRVITAINRSTKVVTFSPATTTAVDNTYGLYIQGSRGLEMQGLRAFTGTDRTLHGINSATAGNSFWNGQRVAASGATAGEDLFQQLADKIGATGQGEVDTFLTTRGIRRRLANTYQSQKRFNDARATTIHGGYSAIYVNEVPVIADDDVPKGWVFAINKDAFKWFELDSPGWLESSDGTVWQMGVSTTASGRRAVWEAWWIWYASLACLAPNRIGAIPDAADDAA